MLDPLPYYIMPPAFLQYFFSLILIFILFLRNIILFRCDFLFVNTNFRNEVLLREPRQDTYNYLLTINFYLYKGGRMIILAKHFRTFYIDKKVLIKNPCVSSSTINARGIFLLFVFFLLIFRQGSILSRGHSHVFLKDSDKA